MITQEKTDLGCYVTDKPVIYQYNSKLFLMAIYWTKSTFEFKFVRFIFHKICQSWAVQFFQRFTCFFSRWRLGWLLTFGLHVPPCGHTPSCPTRHFSHGQCIWGFPSLLISLASAINSQYQQVRETSPSASITVCLRHKAKNKKTRKKRTATICKNNTPSPPCSLFRWKRSGNEAKDYAGVWYKDSD